MADHNGEIITGIAALGTFIGAALAEGLGIFAFLVALLLLFVK